MRRHRRRCCKPRPRPFTPTTPRPSLVPSGIFGNSNADTVLEGGIGMEVNDENTIDLTPDELAALVGGGAETGTDAGAAAPVDMAPPATSTALRGCRRVCSRAPPCWPCWLE